MPIDLEKAASDLIVAAKPCFEGMKEMNAEVFKITPEVRGHKMFTIILVMGEESTNQVLQAVEKVEEGWDA